MRLPRCGDNLLGWPSWRNILDGIVARCIGRGSGISRCMMAAIGPAMRWRKPVADSDAPVGTGVICGERGNSGENGMADLTAVGDWLEKSLSDKGPPW